MPIAYIGIGSNLGNRGENCEKAITLLTQNGIKILKRSSMIETEPWGAANQPKFINMAIEIETEKSPEELLEILKKIERVLGRGENIRWGPRIIDLDILFYENLIIKTPELEVPHPWIAERDFVLMPLAEIAPDKAHPVLRKTIIELRDKD